MDKLAEMMDGLPALTETVPLENGDFRMIFPDNDPNVLVCHYPDKTVFHIEFKPSSPYLGFNRLEMSATAESILFADFFSDFLVNAEDKKALLFSSCSDQVRRVLEELLAYISKNYKTVTLRETAEVFGYHPAYLSSLIRRTTGKTFTRLILDQRMTQAVSYLRQGRLSVDEVACACGYRETISFYKAFTKKYGCTPRRFAGMEELAEE